MRILKLVITIIVFATMISACSKSDSSPAAPSAKGGGSAPGSNSGSKGSPTESGITHTQAPANPRASQEVLPAPVPATGDQESRSAMPPESKRQSSFDPNAEFANICDRMELGKMLARAVHAADCSRVSVKALHDLQDLKIIDLKMKMFPPGGLEGLSSLAFVSIEESPTLEDIHPEAFRGLHALSFLSISQTSISNIRRGTFKELTALKSLMIFKNELETIETNAFEGLSQLTKLTINNLRRRTVLKLQPDAFKGLSSLRRLDLSWNEIDEVVPGAFRDLVQLSSLNLSENNLRDLPPDALKGPVQLRYLGLDFNKFTQVPIEIRRFSSREFTFSFGGNNIDNIPKGIFEDIEMKELLLYETGIKTIEPGAFNGSKIERFLLNKNSIRFLAKDLFKGLSVRELDLSENKISELADGCFTGISAESIDLRDNTLLAVNRDRVGVSKSTYFKGVDDEARGLVAAGTYSTPIKIQPGTPKKPGGKKPLNSTQSAYLPEYNQTHTCDVSEIRAGIYETTNLRCLNSPGVPSDRARISISSSHIMRQFFRGDKEFNDTNAVKFFETKNKAGLCLIRVRAGSFSCNDDTASCMTFGYIGKNKATGKTEMIFPADSFSFCRGADNDKVEQVTVLD